MLNILLVGNGKMGSAMAERWTETQLYNEFVIVDPNQEDIKTFTDIPKDFKPNVVIFAVKPQILPEVIKDYKDFTDNGAVAISIAAGKPISFFEEHLGKDAKITRAMPNLPASIGKGVTVGCDNKNLNDTEKKWVSDLLGATGEFIWVDDEKLLDPVTALSGSGPAYVFLLIETLANAGEKLGLDKELATNLARQTIIGSAELIKENPNTPASEFRKNVTSKGGTTEAALNVLMAENGIQELFDKTLLEAKNRAEKLSN